MRKWMIFLFFLLSACTPPAQPAILPTLPIIFTPSSTPTTAPSPTATAVPPTASAVPTADPNFFRDEFSEELDAQWSWVREDPQHWSLRADPGFLQINATSGSVEGRNNINMLLRPALAGNFQIETQIDFNPRNNYEFAGLIIYASDGTFIQAGRAYCKREDCIGEGLYMNYYHQRVPVKPNYAQPFRERGPILLRLTRQGDTYTFEASTNGKVWFVIGAHTSDMEPVQIGLLAGQHGKGEILTATFDYFEVRSLP